MKFCTLFITAMMVSSSSAFAPSGKVSSSTALKQSIDYNPGPGGFAPSSALSNDPVDATLMNMVRAFLFEFPSIGGSVCLYCLSLVDTVDYAAGERNRK